MAYAGQGAREHARVVSEVLAKCGSRGDCRLWPNNTGIGRGLTGNGIVHFGLKGSSDIIGIGRGGLLLCIEVKTGLAQQSPAQKAFQGMIVRFGGLYQVVHDAIEASNWLDSLNLKWY